MQGLSNFTTTGNSPYSAGPPFPAAAADNGLSVDPVTGHIVLGEDLFSGSGLAALLSPREIPFNGNSLWMTDTPGNFGMQFASGGIVAIDLLNASRAELSASPGTGGFFAAESDSVLVAPPRLTLTDLSVIPNWIADLRQNGSEFGISNTTGAGGSMLTLDQALGLYRIGDLSTGLNGTQFSIDDTLQRVRIDSAGAPYLFMDIPGGLYEFGVVGFQDSVLIDSTNHNAHIWLNGGNALLLDNVSQVYQMGDIDGLGNSTTVTADDINAKVLLSAGNGVKTSAPNGIGTDGSWRLGKPVAAAVALDATQYVEVNIDGTIVKLAVAV